MKKLILLFLISVSFSAKADCDNYFGTLDAVMLYEFQYQEVENSPGAHFLEGRERRQSNDSRFFGEESGDGRFYENREPSSYSDSIDRVPDSYEYIPGYNEPGSETQF